MASRVEEKKRRREEREAAEAAARAAHKRQRMMQTIGVALVAVAVIAVAAVAILNKKDSTSHNGEGTAQGPSAPNDPAARIPPIHNRNLASAAKDAGCVIITKPSAGRDHVETKVIYKTNPPTSGNHNPVPANDGVYAPGNTPTPEHFVHTLEHGRIELQYAPSAPRKVRLQLQSLLAEAYGDHPGGYKVLLFENNTKMPYEVAATAWTHLIGCKKVNDKTWDALRAFRNTYVDKGPEPGIPPNDL